MKTACSWELSGKDLNRAVQVTLSGIKILRKFSNVMSKNYPTCNWTFEQKEFTMNEEMRNEIIQ